MMRSTLCQWQYHSPPSWQSKDIEGYSWGKSPHTWVHISAPITQIPPAQQQPSRRKESAKIVERRWQKLFQDPSIWWDNRQTKRNPGCPDFVHASTGEALWISSCFCPKWVHLELSSLQPAQFFTPLHRAVEGISDTDLPVLDEFSWTRLISEATKCGKAREALRIYKRMRDAGIKPKTYTYIAALKACSSVFDLKAGKEIHAHVMQSGNQWDIFVATTLVDMYAKCGSMVDARRVFENMPYRNLVSWNAMIMGYAQNQEGEAALQLYSQMQCEGWIPDTHTFVAVLKACGSLATQEKGKQVDGKLVKVGCLEKGKAIHSQISASGLESDIFIASSLVEMYAKCKSTMDAHQVFINLPSRNVVLWNAMITSYVQEEDGKTALQYYAKMQQEGFTPNARSFVVALKACCILASQEEDVQVNDEVVKVECLEKGRAIHSQIKKSGFESNMFVASTLMDMYAKCGSMADAHQVFEKTPDRNVVSWTAMIMGHAQREQGKLALKFYARMQQEGVRPNACTFVAALMACSSLASLEAGKEIHAEICKSGFEHDALVTTCLIDMYGKCGNMVEAQQVFDAMPARDVVSWNALIAGYSSQGDSQHVIDLFEKMQQEGIEPVAITFASVLSVCSHAGLVNRGQSYFQAMCLDSKIIPDNEHYHCMVDLLGRAGQLDEAIAMVKSMPFRPSAVSWLIILGACGKWKNLEAGKYAFESAVKLDEKQAAAYILMTNIYASADMWEESVKIQAMRQNVLSFRRKGAPLVDW